MKKIRIVHPNKDYFFSSKLIEKTSSHHFYLLILVIYDIHNKADVFSKANLLFDTINNGLIFPLIEVSENKNYPLISLNPKKKIDNILTIFGKYI